MNQYATAARAQFTQGAIRLTLLALGAAAALVPNVGQTNDFCPDVYNGGKFGPLNFRPAFLQIDKFNHPNGNKYDGLVFSSFFNSIKNSQGTSVVGFFERDLVARIQGIGYRYPAWFNVNRDVEVLTDLTNPSPVLPSGPGQQNWPNEVQRVPDGILNFEAVVSPQGFHPAYAPGRLTLINLDHPDKQEYIIDQSLETAGIACRTQDDPSFNPLTKPWFYHLVKWFDMDGDGLQDAVTVRSGFRVRGAFCIPPEGEVVWFKNPGTDIDPAVEWEEFVIAGYPSSQWSADISLDMHDLTGDGVPEIVANRFFGPPSVPGEFIEIYGARVGETWADVDPATNPARTAVISDNQGRPFGVKFVDLNRDGKMEVLATNHQSDNCFPRTQDAIPSRVYALQQPASGDVFNDPWITHILKDNIRPNPTYPALPLNSAGDPNPAGPGRLAPGLAQEFWPTPMDEATSRPWILVGGDEASKVWLLKPNSQNPSDWSYDSAVIFDINDYYGPNTTQSLTAPAPDSGNSISTIGTPAWRYDRGWAWGSYAEIYIPVFEARDIHRISFRPANPATKVVCPADGALACPAP